MTNPIRLCLVLHNHQPIGNFDHVFEQAYQDSYLPFLDVFEQFADLKISLHTSGPLMEWLDERHGEYLDRVAALVQQGRIEIIGGPFYEPILTMIPPRDRVGQIQRYTEWLQQRLGGNVRGMWVPERVWEQSLTSDIVTAGIEYTVLDDFHFRNAGLADEDLHSYYVTEDNGHVLRVFPGSERLRYVIPFADPEETINYLRHVADRHPGAVAVFGDDGEKFGTWPETKKHVYEDGWLQRFFETVSAHQEWVIPATLSEAVGQLQPAGKIYLPDGSYREMTEWALPTERQVEYESVTHEFEKDDRWHRLRPFIRGGFWRNFRVKYPETNEMYSRMMAVSRRLESVRDQCSNSDAWQSAERELYRGQCNCSYWHGAFGGIYLPHLRHAVFNHLIAADNLIDQAVSRKTPWVEATASDFDFDGQQEVCLANDRLMAWIAPASGGQIYELDVRRICLNLAASLTRRPEVYHRKVLKGGEGDQQDVASIHDRVSMKQEGLDQRLQYDSQPRRSLIDHFYDDHVSVEAIQRGEERQRGDFVFGVYETRVRRNPDRMQVLMSREGNAWGHPLKITKGVSLDAGQDELEVTYVIENLPPERTFHFSVEFNFAGLPSGADDRFFFQGNEENVLGHLGTLLDLHDVRELGLVDQWQGIALRWQADRESHVWAYPVETVSQSEGGIELVHQSVAVQPHWFVSGDADGTWKVTMRLQADTQAAELRNPAAEASESVA